MEHILLTFYPVYYGFLTYREPPGWLHVSAPLVGASISVHLLLRSSLRTWAAILFAIYAPMGVCTTVLLLGYATHIW